MAAFNRFISMILLFIRIDLCQAVVVAETNLARTAVTVFNDEKAAYAMVGLVGHVVVKFVVLFRAVKARFVSATTTA